jgi:WD40 repeat protein
MRLGKTGLVPLRWCAFASVRKSSTSASQDRVLVAYTQPASSTLTWKNSCLVCATLGTCAMKLNEVFDFTEPGNEINCLDFCLDGSQFATAGKDLNVRLYDANTNKVRLIDLWGLFNTMFVFCSCWRNMRGTALLPPISQQDMHRESSAWSFILKSSTLWSPVVGITTWRWVREC